MVNADDKFSASAQGLGYYYQPRIALLKLFQLPEDSSVLIEKEDDLDFVDNNGTKTLMSLKHKKVGGSLTNLSVDFWKSVRIWLHRYDENGRTESNLKFFLFTTENVKDNSDLSFFLVNFKVPSKINLVNIFENILNESGSSFIKEISEKFQNLNENEKFDFVSKIAIFDNTPRINDIPQIIQHSHMRCIQKEHRQAVFESLEGWWNDQVLNILIGKRIEPIVGYELSDKLFSISQEYRADNLPITFMNEEPSEGVDVESDDRTFVSQLKEIGISTAGIRKAILDYYRAYEQRSLWAREYLLLAGELEKYEDRLVEEWERYKEYIFETLDSDSADMMLMDAGKKLYKWAELESVKLDFLRIRKKVDEPYVIRGAFHILANNDPIPRVYWHPHFLNKLKIMLGRKK